MRISSPQSFCLNVVVQVLLIKVVSLISDALCCDFENECPFLNSKITKQKPHFQLNFISTFDFRIFSYDFQWSCRNIKSCIILHIQKVNMLMFFSASEMDFSTPPGMALKILLWDQLDNTVTIKRILLKYFTLIITGQPCVVNL